MKIYEIRDGENRRSVGVLLYYEKCRSFVIELEDDLDEWTAPLLFVSFVKKHIYTIPEMISRMWVEERIIPSGRQNIGLILDNHKLSEYDEMKFLELSKGKCSQDHLYICRINDIPDYVLERQKKNISECVVTGDDCLLCFFMDGTVKKISLDHLSNADDVEKILNNRALLQSGHVGVGGYSVNFGGSIDIPAGVLYDEGVLIPLTLNDFLDFVKGNIYDTSESCTELKCSRQNLAYMQDKTLTPVKENVKGNLYLKGDILKASYL